jgi:hypothetical protein
LQAVNGKKKEVVSKIDALEQKERILHVNLRIEQKGYTPFDEKIFIP